MTFTDTWDPAQYARFARERRQPFDDLAALVEPIPGGTAVDLGCGSGELTATLHGAIDATLTVGIDNSEAMLARAATVAEGVPGLSFSLGDLGDFAVAGMAPAEPHLEAVDLVFANASLHWVDDHRALVTGLRRRLNPGGQLAFQVPDNWGHPSHTVAYRLARDPAFRDQFVGGVPAERRRAVLGIEAYAELFEALGATDQVVRRQIYGHHLTSVDDIVEWVKGTLLTPYRKALGSAGYESFLHAYREELTRELGNPRPYFYGFARILCWARFP